MTDRTDRTNRTGRTGYDAEDVVRVLQQQLGTRYEESYEHGKRDMRDALVKHLGLHRDEAGRIVDDLEAAQAIRFKSAGESSSLDTEVPRVGLFDEPGPVREERQEPSAGGRYWAIGSDEDVDLPGSG
jgi:hypothetical protein